MSSLIATPLILFTRSLGSFCSLIKPLTTGFELASIGNYDPQRALCLHEVCDGSEIFSEIVAYKVN